MISQKLGSTLPFPKKDDTKQFFSFPRVKCVKKCVKNAGTNYKIKTILLVRSTEGTDHINWSRVSNTLTVAYSWHLVDVVESVRTTTRSLVYMHVSTSNTNATVFSGSAVNARTPTLWNSSQEALATARFFITS